jgi:hypothetical protein
MIASHLGGREIASASAAHQSVGKPACCELPTQRIAIVTAVGVDCTRRPVEELRRHRHILLVGGGDVHVEHEAGACIDRECSL